MILKNINTGSIGEFAVDQGEDWIAATEEEIEAIELSLTKDLYLVSRRVYLAATNDAALEALETTSILDAGIAANRALARSDIIGINAATMSEDLDSYSPEFP